MTVHITSYTTGLMMLIRTNALLLVVHIFDLIMEEFPQCRALGLEGWSQEIVLHCKWLWPEGDLLGLSNNDSDLSMDIQGDKLNTEHK